MHRQSKVHETLSDLLQKIFRDNIRNLFACRVLTHGYCLVLPRLIEFSGVVPSCFRFCRWTTFTEVLPIEPEDSHIPLFKAIIYSRSWVWKLVHSVQLNVHNVWLWGQPPRAHLHVVGMLPFMFLTETNRACPLLFILFLCLFLSLWPFRVYFIPQILLTALSFLTLFFRSHFCPSGPFNYKSL